MAAVNVSNMSSTKPSKEPQPQPLSKPRMPTPTKSQVFRRRLRAILTCGQQTSNSTLSPSTPISRPLLHQPSPPAEPPHPTISHPLSPTQISHPTSPTPKSVISSPNLTAATTSPMTGPTFNATSPMTSPNLTAASSPNPQKKSRRESRRERIEVVHVPRHLHWTEYSPEDERNGGRIVGMGMGMDTGAER
ncbi:hypothetical protein M011DRAFT_278023 [Sporormia fimetaria CBS 119925]|uniref:Uncharacterized protein n=1 Tax=Sporormia fimetaria CBS 119925 TaxID=1340428 RepID=A0A6A6VJ37_9PLEO|nr:hypothetical protein M011DRAFT_278023 [Sporormia fimetaria CBS 119925]